MENSLFVRLGGPDAVEAAVDLFYRKVLADQDINHFFNPNHMPQLRTKQRAFMTMAFGGPHRYSGMDLRTAHAPLVAQGLNDQHFDAVARHLEETLTELFVPRHLIEEVMGIVGGTRNDVLNR